MVFWLCAGLIFYAYLGYPLLAALLARFRPRLPKYTLSDAELPTVTLIIAAYNEQAVIARKLENALALDYPRERLQIMVAADGSDDNTVSIVQSFAERGVALSYTSERAGKMAAINRAVAHATGEIVVFSDANNLYEAGGLKALVAPFCDPSVGATSGAKIIQRGDGVLGESEGLYWKYESLIKQQENRLGSTTGVVGEMLAIRRALFEPAPAWVINDDFYLAMQVIRKGFRVLYVPEARSYERVSPTAQDEMTRRARIVAGRYGMIANPRETLPLNRPLVAWQVISHKYMRALVPLAMIGALLANLLALVFVPSSGRSGLLRLAPPFAWIVFTLQVLFYAAAWVGGRVGKRGVLGKILYIPAFLVNSNLAALAGLVRFLSGRQKAAWQRVARREES